MSIISSPRPASATEPKPSPTPTSTGSPEPSPQRPGTVPQGHVAGGSKTLPLAPGVASKASRRRSLYVDQLAISAAAKPPNRLICARHSAPAPTMKNDVCEMFLSCREAAGKRAKLKGLIAGCGGQAFEHLSAACPPDPAPWCGSPGAADWYRVASCAGAGGCLCEALGLGRHYWLGARRSMAAPTPSVSEGGRIASPLYVIACA